MTNLNPAGQSIINFCAEVPYNIKNLFSEIHYATFDDKTKSVIEAKMNEIISNLTIPANEYQTIQRAIKYSLADFVKDKKNRPIQKEKLNSLVACMKGFNSNLLSRIPPHLYPLIKDLKELTTAIVLEPSESFQRNILEWIEIIQFNEPYRQEYFYFNHSSFKSIAQKYAGAFQGEKPRQEILDHAVDFVHEISSELRKLEKTEIIGADDLLPALLAAILRMKNSRIKCAVESLDILFQQNSLFRQSDNYMGTYIHLSGIIYFIDHLPWANSQNRI